MHVATFIVKFIMSMFMKFRFLCIFFICTFKWTYLFNRPQLIICDILTLRGDLPKKSGSAAASIFCINRWVSASTSASLGSLLGLCGVEPLLE